MAVFEPHIGKMTRLLRLTSSRPIFLYFHKNESAVHLGHLQLIGTHENRTGKCLVNTATCGLELLCCKITLSCLCFYSGRFLSMLNSNAPIVVDSDVKRWLWDQLLISSAYAIHESSWNNVSNFSSLNFFGAPERSLSLLGILLRWGFLIWELFFLCSLPWLVEFSPMAWEIWVQFQVESYQRLKKWYSIPPCLTLSTQVRIKGKVEQSRGRSSALPYTLVL